MSYKQLREKCFFKTGREGVVLEVIDQLKPNLFDNNRRIDNSIFNRDSKITFTLVDARKAAGKGRAIYYNLDPNEVLLLNYLLSDGIPAHFKKRVGAYNNLTGQEQIYIRNLVETFDSIDFTRFDRAMDYSKANEAVSIVFQKNIGIGGDKLLIRKFMLSYEEAMRSASKWKITIEIGEGIKDSTKGNGLNIVKSGTYKTTDKTFLMLQADEVVVPISESSKRVSISQSIFYSFMKRAEADFTNRKIKNQDYEGERIDEWNPQGKPKWGNNNTDSEDDVSVDTDTNTNIESETSAGVENTKNDMKNENTENVKPSNVNENSSFDEKKCNDCGVSIDEKVYNYSMKFHEEPLCYNCQKKKKKK